MSGRELAPGGLALAEALVNTLDIETGEDLLGTREQLAYFGLRARELPAARELRESLRAACLAHGGLPPHTEVTPLAQLLAAAPLVVRVEPADGTAALAALDPAPLLSRVALAIAEGAAARTWPRLKACESPTCHWAFYDRSPAARGRWCSMAVCGARAKMRTYRSRQTN